MCGSGIRADGARIKAPGIPLAHAADKVDPESSDPPRWRDRDVADTAKTTDIRSFSVTDPVHDPRTSSGLAVVGEALLLMDMGQGLRRYSHAFAAGGGVGRL